MIKLKDLKIYIVSVDMDVTEALNESFSDIKNVFIYNEDIRDFYDKKSDEIDCLVSPANSYGYMTGGYDAALSDILGWEFQYKVQGYIKRHYFGEQPVASSFIIDTDIPGLRLIHTPTMRYPDTIEDDMIIYQCMRTTLMCALRHDVTCIVIPAFGASIGGVDPYVVADRMLDGYLQIKSKAGAKYEF